ncbi:MAG TPA: phosphatase PAP2 family protein [Pedococcus sp.]|nr:phosphatase PAP2 family protein [Pedococcus sp.]
MDRFHRKDGSDLLTRAIGPGIVLWGLIVGIGFLITGPLAALDRGEDTVAAAFNRNRTDLWDMITDVWSRVGNTEIIIATCVVVTAVLLWRTRDWRFSAVPAIAISMQATIFVIAAHTVGRIRPPVLPEDPSPPTSSYPSGHVGAATALYTSFALLAAERIERDWLRRTVIGLCVLMPLLVTFSRLYRGAHHISDVVVGILNGLACALLAYGWYRHRARETGTQTRQHRATVLR